MEYYQLVSECDGEVTTFHLMGPPGADFKAVCDDLMSRAAHQAVEGIGYGFVDPTTVLECLAGLLAEQGFSKLTPTVARYVVDDVCELPLCEPAKTEVCAHNTRIDAKWQADIKAVSEAATTGWFG